MIFRRIEAFCKVYEEKSFSKAGEALLLSQPTISSHVIALEKTLGIKLFDRIGRHIAPTIAGDSLYRCSRDAMDSFEKALIEIARMREMVAGAFTLGASTIPADYILPDILRVYLQKYPEVRLSLRVGSSKEISAAVLFGELALGIVGHREEGDGLHYELLAHDEAVLVGSPEFIKQMMRGEKNSNLSLRDILKWPWIMRSEGSGTRQSFANVLEKAGFDLRDLNMILQLENMPIILNYVKAGLGVSVSSSLAVKADLERQSLVRLPLNTFNSKRSFYLVTNGKRLHFPAVTTLIDQIKDSTSTLR